MYKVIQQTRTISSPKNLLSRPALRRHVLFAIVPATAFVAAAVAFSLLARAGKVEAQGGPRKFRVLATIPLQSNAWGSVTVNQALNKIYTSGNPSNNFDLGVTVIDGVTFATTPVGYGSQVSVDNKTNRYWAATIYQDNLIVRDGTTNSIITTVPIPGGVCPIDVNYDFSQNRMWSCAQCGGLHDPIFAVNASPPYNIIAGPIDSGGIVGGIIVNGANGRLYFTDQDGGSGPYISKRVNPTTFVVTNNAFGKVVAINALTNKLYAIPDGTNKLQIINGAPDPEVVLKTISLPYAPGRFGINPAFNVLYVVNPAGNDLEVRDLDTGALINIFTPLPATPNGSMAVDSVRGRIYIISSTPSLQLMVIEDLINAFKPGAIISRF